MATPGYFISTHLSVHTGPLWHSGPVILPYFLASSGPKKNSVPAQSGKLVIGADFLPDKTPEFGQCVHKMVMHPSQPNVIYQQNHCGIYRSDNAGDDWIDIGDGKLPSRFGFPIAVHPFVPKTIYVVLEESDEYRMSIGGKFAVWRSQDAGESWEKLTRGLPQLAYLVVLRQAMAVDTLHEAGVYIGTSTGQLFFSRNSGDTWELLADFLPPIYSVEVAVIN